MIRFVPRGVLDIDWNHLLRSLFQTLFPAANREAEFPSGTLPTLSVRTAFDLYLQHLQADPGDEIIMSSVSIPEMFAIAEAHQLKVVPVPVRFSDLSIQVEDIAAAITGRTRMIVVAPLFGVRFSLDDIAALAESHGIPVLEDCAQVWHGHSTLTDFSSRLLGNPLPSGTDSQSVRPRTIQLYSFGPIKTATALGGAVIVDWDQKRLETLAEIQSRYPMVSRSKSLRRLLRYIILKQVSLPFLYGVLVKLCRVFGQDYDEVLFRMTRGFPGTGLLNKFRYRLNSAQRCLLTRRFYESHDAWISRRREFAQQLISRIDQRCVPGMSASSGLADRIHSHWVIPFESSNPGALIGQLRKSGFDATSRASSLVCYGGSQLPDRNVGNGDILTADRLANLVYLPNYPSMTLPELERMVEVINTSRPREREGSA